MHAWVPTFSQERYILSQANIIIIAGLNGSKGFATLVTVEVVHRHGLITMTDTKMTTVRFKITAIVIYT